MPHKQCKRIWLEHQNIDIILTNKVEKCLYQLFNLFFYYRTWKLVRMGFNQKASGAGWVRSSFMMLSLLNSAVISMLRFKVNFPFLGEGSSNLSTPGLARRVTASSWDISVLVGVVWRIRWHSPPVTTESLSGIGIGLGGFIFHNDTP